ncbi:unnamed protein product [Bursaphelenchus okinawaensis]|uniref:protein-tyrosine-phosphatase n=1 Tax=Bursaphelenchus okinawaensis TaxID=465554 RepID=A0A811JU87_9BILA|nr:unnamed protein product [Bursaphelenchus okinawaensis]CAG9082835.1 unnamed protein product [Bursaphelenchus okinawaensis]
MDIVHKGAGDLIKQFEEHEKKNNWGSLFMAIHEISEKQERELELSCDVPLAPKNIPKNRYCNIVPYDQHLVQLSDIYINASKLTVPLTNKTYVFTQGPLENTSEDFWHMVWEQDCKIVVMLCTFMERNVPKCFPYFPYFDEKVQTFGDFKLELDDEEDNKNYIVRRLKITKEGEEDHKIVQHYQYTTWPDFGVPDNVFDFLEFVEAVRNFDETVNSPIVCHCSAGVGRTGTFTVVDVLISAIRAKVDEALPSIDDLVLYLRKYRMSLVQTPAQLRFSWKAIVEYIKSKAAMIDNEESVEDEENNAVEDVKPEATKARKRRSENNSIAEEAAAQKRDRQKRIDAMKQRQLDFESRKKARDYWKTVFLSKPVVVGAVVGAVLLYRYFL